MSSYLQPTESDLYYEMLQSIQKYGTWLPPVDFPVNSTIEKSSSLSQQVMNQNSPSNYSDFRLDCDLLGRLAESLYLPSNGNTNLQTINCFIGSWTHSPIKYIHALQVTQERGIEFLQDKNLPIIDAWERQIQEDEKKQYAEDFDKSIYNPKTYNRMNYLPGDTKKDDVVPPPPFSETQNAFHRFRLALDLIESSDTSKMRRESQMPMELLKQAAGIYAEHFYSPEDNKSVQNKSVKQMKEILENEFKKREFCLSFETLLNKQSKKHETTNKIAELTLHVKAFFDLVDMDLDDLAKNVFKQISVKHLFFTAEKNTKLPTGHQLKDVQVRMEQKILISIHQNSRKPASNKRRH